MTEQILVTQLGVAGVIVVLLLIAVRVLWQDNKQLRAESRADQQVILPALTQATSALATASTAIDHVTRLYELAPRSRGNG